MAFINSASCECAKSELDLFTLQPTQTSIEESAVVEYHPISSIQNKGPIEFDVTGTGDQYIDVSNIQLYIRAKITKRDGNNLEPNSTAAPVNLLLHSMFSQIDISLNGTLISNATNTYPYRALLETLLTYGEDAKHSQLTCQLFYKDEAGYMDSVLVGNQGGNRPNTGLQNRRTITKESKEFDMVGRLHADLFFQERYLLNEVGIKIRLIRSKDDFCLMGVPQDATLQVIHAALFVRKVKLSPSVFLAHADSLQTSTAKYPIKRCVCKALAIPQNYSDMTYEKLITGQLPTRVVIGLVDNAAFNGARNLNPFNFQNFNVSEVALFLDGQQSQTSRPIELNYDKGLFIHGYNSLFAGTVKLNRDEGLQIARLDYDRGYALYAYDLTADLDGEDHYNLIRHGNVRLCLKFATPLPQPLTIIAYAEFDNVLEISKDRQILSDFGI